MTTQLATLPTSPNDLYAITGQGLTFLREPTLEEWQSVHSQIARCKIAALRWLADSRKAGREYFGEETVVATEEQLMLPLGDIKAASALEALPDRPAALTDEHLLALQKRLPNEVDFQKWAAIAEEQKLTVAELVASLKAGRVVRADEKPESVNPQDKSVGIVTIEGISTSFGMWYRKVKETGFPEKWSDEQLRRVEQLLIGMANVHAAVVTEQESRR